MPILMPGDVHVNRELSMVMVSYAQQTDSFIADKVFPNIPVDKQTDFFNKMGRKSFLTTQMKKRAPRTETAGVDWNFTRDTYAAEVWGLHHDIEDQFRSNADDNWQLDATGTSLITQQGLLRREKEWFNAYFKTGVWAVDWTGVVSAPTGNQFIQFDQAASTPTKFFRQRRRAFHKRTGVRPNTVVFAPEVWDTLIDHPEFIERVKYSSESAITQAIVSRYLEIDNVYIGEAVEATDYNEELTATVAPTTQYLTNKGFWYGYAAKQPSRDVPSAGYTFSWKGYAGASAFGGRIKKFRMENVASDRVEIEMAYDFKVVAPELGEFYAGAVS